MNCSHCGAPLEETDSVCPQCGAAVEREGVVAADEASGAAEDEAVKPAEAGTEEAVKPVEAGTEDDAEPVEAGIEEAAQPVEAHAEKAVEDSPEIPVEEAAADVADNGSEGGASVPPTPPAPPVTPASSSDADAVPPQFAGEPVYAKGCVAQALDDIRHLPGARDHIIGICAIIAACSIVPVVGWVAAAILGVCSTGFALEWGRDLSRGRGIDRGGSFPRVSLFSLGFFSGALEVALQVLAWLPVLALCMAGMLAAGGISSLFFHDFQGGYSDTGLYRSYGDIYGPGAGSSFLGGLVGFLFLLIVICIVFSVFMAVLSSAASMHLAVTGRIESAFSLKRIWQPVKRQFGKLFCCTFAPAVVAFVIAFILIGCVMLLMGLIGSAFSCGGARLLGGFFFLLSPALSSFIASFAAIFAVIWQYRATGHWAARYAPQWAHEGDGSQVSASAQLPASK